MNKFSEILNKAGASRIVLGVILIYWCSLLLEEKRWGNGEIVVSDIKGYYAYVPSLLFNSDPSFERSNELSDHARGKIWIDHKDGKNFVRMYIGTAVCYAPFSLVAHAVAKSREEWSDDGYSLPYYIALAISALFFGFWGLLIVRKLCREFVSDTVAAIVLMLLAFGTNLTFYSTYYGPYSHIYSFWAISLFVWLTIKWHQQPTVQRSVLLGLVGGMVVIIRPTNGIIAMFFLFWGVTQLADFKARLALLWEKKLLVLLLIVAAFSVLLIQLGYWKYTLGTWFSYTYGEQGFDFAHPQFSNVLFSYRKGWLLYTPLMLFAVLGMFFLRKKIKSGIWIVPLVFLVHLYVVSSWHSWWYGDAYSQRPMVDMYAILALALAAIVHTITTSRWLLIHISIAGVFLAGIFLNTFQMQQYKDGIIHYDGMTEEAYWAVWMKDRFPEGFDNLILHPDLDRLANFEPEYIPSLKEFEQIAEYKLEYSPRDTEQWVPDQLSNATQLDEHEIFPPTFSIPLQDFNNPNIRYRAVCTANLYVEQAFGPEQFSLFLSSVAQARGHYKKYDSWSGEITAGGRTSMTHSLDLWTPFTAEDSLKLGMQYNSGPPVFLESFEVRILACPYPTY